MLLPTCFVVLSLLTPARAQDLALANVRAVAWEVTPTVEQLAGRTFRTRPRVQLSPVAELERLLEDAGRASSGAPDLVGGLYLQADGSVHVLDASLPYLADGMGGRIAFSRPLLRCILAHELTHALQDQYGVWEPLDPEATVEQRQVRGALLEGHAALVELRVCGSERATLQGDDPWLLAKVERELHEALPPQTELGRAFLAEVEAAGGPEAVWQELAESPPTLAVLEERVAAATGPGWPTAEQLDQRLRPMLDETHWEAVALDGAGRSLLAATIAGEAIALPRPLDEVLWSAEAPGVRVVAGVLALSTDAEARAVLEVRRRLVERARQDTMAGAYLLVPGLDREELSGGPWSVREVASLASDRPVDQVLRVRVGQSAHAYEELWMRAGSELRVVAVSSAVRLLRGARSMGLGLLDAVPAVEPDLRERLEAARRHLEGEGVTLPDATWPGLWIQAVWDLDRGEPCEEGLEEAARTASGLQREALGTAFFACAVVAEDEGAAVEALDLLAEQAVPDDVAAPLVHVLVAQERAAALGALLPKLDRRSPAGRQLAEQVEAAASAP